MRAKDWGWRSVHSWYWTQNGPSSTLGPFRHPPAVDAAGVNHAAILSSARSIRSARAGSAETSEPESPAAVVAGSPSMVHFLPRPNSSDA
jgi:hypothetical protein